MKRRSFIAAAAAALCRPSSLASPAPAPGLTLAGLRRIVSGLTPAAATAGDYYCVWVDVDDWSAELRQRHAVTGEPPLRGEFGRIEGFRFIESPLKAR